jgi:hypothetical protein
MCNDDDVPLFTKKTFAAGQPPNTKEADIEAAVNADFHSDGAGFSLD